MKTTFFASSALVLAGLAIAPAFSTADSAAASRLEAGPAPVTWTVDPVHSGVGFRIRHLNTSWFHGRFNAMSGSVVLDAEKPAASSVQFEVDVASVDTANKDRDEHLRGPDFFNAKVNPKFSFKSSKVAPEGKDKYNVTGKLNLHGVEKEISFVAEATGTGKNMQGADIAGFETTFTIKRSDFGISTYPDALGDEVAVRVAIEAIKKS